MITNSLYDHFCTHGGRIVPPHSNMSKRVRVPLSLSLGLYQGCYGLRGLRELFLDKVMYSLQMATLFQRSSAINRSSLCNCVKTTKWYKLSI